MAEIEISFERREVFYRASVVEGAPLSQDRHAAVV
jgi:hypothetical protein